MNGAPSREPPRLTAGVPDYTPATNARRLAGLRRLQARLRAINSTGWTISEQVDLHLARGRLMEEVIAMRARQLGDAFTMQRMMDEISAARMIPVSMIYWEVTGDDRVVRVVRELREGRPLPVR